LKLLREIKEFKLKYLIFLLNKFQEKIHLLTIFTSVFS
jgi:hypothetical protein